MCTAGITPVLKESSLSFIIVVIPLCFHPKIVTLSLRSSLDMALNFEIELF